MGAIKGVVKQQGIRRGLFAGYGSFMLRDLPFDVIEFVACVPPNPSHGGRVESGLHGRWKPPTQPPLCATAARELTDADGVGGVRERERERERGDRVGSHGRETLRSNQLMPCSLNTITFAEQCYGRCGRTGTSS
jgi:hypothetical protein